MADIFNAFAAGTRLGMERRQAQMAEQRAAEEQNRLAKINQLTSQAYGANDPTQRNALAQQVTALGGAQAGQNVMAIGAQQGEANTLAKQQRMEQIVRRVASVAQVPAGPEREAAWAAGVREVLGNDPQAEQLVQLGADQGITAVASQVAPVADVLAKIGYSPAAGAQSARAAGFNQLIAGLSPEEQAEARRVELGLAPRAAAPGFSVQEVTLPDGTTQFIQVPTRGMAPGAAIPVNVGGYAAPAPQYAPPQAAPAGMSFEEANAIMDQRDAEAGGLAPEAYQQGLNELMGGAAPQVAPNRAALFGPINEVGGGGMGLGQTDAQRAAAAAQREEMVAGARARGTAAAERAQAAPADIRQAELTLQNIEQLLADPRVEILTGVSGAVDPRNWPIINRSGAGTADVEARILQIQGAAFLEAFERLKGGGAITEIEGRKAEQAIARLNTAQSDEGFRAALIDLRDVLRDSIQRNRQAVGGNQSAPAEDDVSDLLRMYGGQ